MHHSYCEACGARDAGLRHETVCDVCDRVFEKGELRSELRINDRVGFVVCRFCVVKILPHAAIKVEEQSRVRRRYRRGAARGTSWRRKMGTKTNPGSREALELARECGWGKDRTRRLP